MTIPDDLDPPGGDPSSDDPSEEGPTRGDGAARVPLSEAINAVLDVPSACAGDLAAVRHRLRQQELPEELDIDESQFPRPGEQARHIAAWLETCAGAPRNASGEIGDQPGLSSDE